MFRFVGLRDEAANPTYITVPGINESVQCLVGHELSFFMAASFAFAGMLAKIPPHYYPTGN
jgi:hypothetical protein